MIFTEQFCGEMIPLNRPFDDARLAVRAVYSSLRLCTTYQYLSQIMNLLKVLLLATAAVAKQPNILFVLTDDQGKYVGGLEHMPKLQVRLFPTGPSRAASKLTVLERKHSYNKGQATPTIFAPSHYAVPPERTFGQAACHTTPTLQMLASHTVVIPR